MTLVIEINDVRAAAQRLAGIANRTPVLTSRRLDERVGAQLFLKAENHQRTGSFKFRGAYNRVSQLSADELARGIVSISSGNHAQAVALSARLAGTSAVIFMPEDTPKAKREATAAYGAQIVNFDRYADDRDDLIASKISGTGRTFVPPYDHPHIMAGQGTAALELFEEIGDLDALVVPVSGGGLIAGSGVVAKTLSPDLRLYGVEPAEGNDTKRSLEAGERVRVPVPRTIADGLQVNIPGELTFDVNKNQIDEVALVTDEEIVEAMRFYFETLKIVVEPSGAVSLAALLTGKLDVAARRVGVVISGGNVGIERFMELVTR